MATYPPNFNDQGIIDLCINSGYPVTVDGFYNAINDATGNTNGSIDDIWRLYITDVLGYTFVGQHPAHYGLSFGDGLPSGGVAFPELTTVTYTPGVNTIEVNGICGVDGNYYGYVTTTTANITWGYSDFLDDEAIGHVGFRAISIRQNAYIDSATLTLKFAAVGVNWPGGKLYAKKLEQNAIAVPNDSGYDWVSGGKLTTAYIQIPSSQTATTATFDAKEILLELMAAGWDETDHIVQFVCVADAACPDDTYLLSHDKRESTTEFNPALEVVYYESASNAETAAITDGYVINYMPVSDADLAIANRLRFVVQDDAGSREDGVVLAGDYAPFISTTVNAPRKTVAVAGELAELDAVNWNVLPQARFFGRKYSGHPELAQGALLSTLSYTDGWQFLPRNYDYLWAAAIEFESTDVLNSWWDVWNYRGFGGTTSQSAMFLTATGTTLAGIANANEVVLDLQVGTRVQVTETGITAGAGRTLRIMLFWDHVASAWYWRLVVEDAAGAVIIDRNNSASVANTWDPTSMTAQNIDRRWLVGFRLDGGARMFGHAIIEWRRSAANIWEDSADWMTKSWVRGIKSLDPRLMTP
jgi:hypothetical protein